MLKEVQNVGAAHREARCRWFRSERADLYVWPAKDGPGEVMGAFEYCYRNLQREYRLSWDRPNGVRFARVDDGESSPLRNDSPLVIPGEAPDVATAARHFREEGLGMDPQIYRFILNVLYEQVGGEPYSGDEKKG
jgi:hypothetical protein